MLNLNSEKMIDSLSAVEIFTRAVNFTLRGIRIMQRCAHRISKDKILRGNSIWKNHGEEKENYYFQRVTVNLTELTLCIQSLVLIQY